MKQHIVRIALGLAITLFFIGHAARYYEVPFITQLDNIIYDARLQVTMPGGVDERIVILDIDEKSLEEVGRWPWPRSQTAELVEAIARSGPTAQFHDWMIPEKSTPLEDRRMAEALKSSGNVTLAYLPRAGAQQGKFRRTSYRKMVRP